MVFLKEAEEVFVFGLDEDLGLKGVSDEFFVLARDLEGLGDLCADFKEPFPFLLKVLRDLGQGFFREGGKMHAFTFPLAREVAPDLFGGKGEDGGHKPG